MGYLTGGHPENDQALTRPQYVPRQIRKKKMDMYYIGRISPTKFD